MFLTWLTMMPFVLFDQALVAGLFDELGDPLERPLDRLVLPLVAVRRPVSECRDAVQVGDELQRVGSLGAKPPPVDWAARVTFDVDDLPALGVGQLAAPDRAVRAH